METLSAISDFNEVLKTQLDARKSEGLYRTLHLVGSKIDFSSNDYFGFARQNFLMAEGGGATGSRSISGNSIQAEEAEITVARYHGFEAALIFNSGYCANVGLFSCLARRGDTYIADELIHASIIDGMRLSHAARLRFRHNDLADLECKLKAAGGRKFVAVESVYSMDGDVAPLKQIVELCNYYNALLIVDEAHATGVFGEKGEGLVSHLGLQQDVYACTYTFGKALGLHGAAVSGNSILREYLINNARSFIFTTALPPGSYKNISEAYARLATADRKGLHSLIEYFGRRSSELKNFEFHPGISAVQALKVPGNFNARALAEHLSMAGIFVKAILSPTVAPGTERIRICLHSFNTKDEVDHLLNTISLFKS